MREQTLKVGLLAGAITFLSTPALALEIRTDGFASIVYGQTFDKDELDNNGEFRGYNEKADFQADSLYGIQFSTQLTDDVTATGQITGKGNDNFKAKVSWAYLTFEINDEWRLKAGRQRIPFFLYSDFLDVGYAYSWISPPHEVYNLGGFDNIDGLTLQYNTDIGPWVSRLSLVYGSSDTDVEVQGNISNILTDNFWDVTWNMNWDWLTIQLTYSESEVTLQGFNDLAAGINDLNNAAILYGIPGATALTRDQLDYISSETDRSHFTGVALAGDWGTYFAVAEWTKIELSDAPNSHDRSAWYVAGGYRHNKYVFTLTYAEYDDPNNPDTLDTVEAITPTLGQVALGGTGNDVLQAGAVQLLDNLGAYLVGRKSESYNLAVRYDLNQSTAIKMDYTSESVEYDPGTGTKIDRDPSLIRVGVDVVF